MKYYLNEKYLDGMKIDVTGLAQVFKWKLVTSQTGRILADFQTHVSQLFETATTTETVAMAVFSLFSY